MGDGTGLAEAILGLDGFRVLAVDESSSEVGSSPGQWCTKQRLRRSSQAGRGHPAAASMAGLGSAGEGAFDGAALSDSTLM